MKTRVFVIFGFCYGILLAALMGAGVILSNLADWDPSADGIDNLFGILFFTVAIMISLMRRAHAKLGGAPDMIAFRSILSENCWSLTVGIVVVTTIVNFAVTIVSSWYGTDEMAWPSPLRTAMMSIVYGVLARVIIVESVERMRYA